MIYLYICLLVTVLGDELRISYTLDKRSTTEVFPAWNSIVEVEIKFLNLNLISRPPDPSKFFCADAGLPFLGHCNLDFLDAILFPNDWQESLLSVARNQKLAGAFQ